MASPHAEPARAAPDREAAPVAAKPTSGPSVGLPAQIGNGSFLALLRAEPPARAQPPTDVGGQDAVERVKQRAAGRVSRSPSAAAFAAAFAAGTITLGPGAATTVRRWPWTKPKQESEVSGPSNGRPMTYAEQGGVPSNAQLIKQKDRQDRRDNADSGDTAGLGTMFGGPEAESPGKDGAVAPAQDRGKKPEHPPKKRPGFDLAGGQEILTKAFGDVKKIVPGKIEVLEQKAFEKAYDKIYGDGDYSWAKYVKPKYGSLNGFAHDGVNYINKSSAGLHTIVHEMLHNNTADDWLGVVGDRWNEGTTEVLTKRACKLFFEPAPTCYPGESPVVDVAISHGLPVKDLQDAYLVGGAKEKVADWVDTHCVLSWAEVKEKMQANQWAAAKAGLARKKSKPPASKGKAKAP